jgi:hypothetical protein
MKQFAEKVMIKGFYKWKFGVKRKRNDESLRKIEGKSNKNDENSRKSDENFIKSDESSRKNEGKLRKIDESSKRNDEGSHRKLNEIILIKHSRGFKQVEKKFVSRMKKIKPQDPKSKVVKMIKNIEKDMKYRVKICFSHWKQESSNLSLMHLKVLSFLHNFNLLLNMRRSWVLNTIKRVNKTPLFNY